MVEKPVQRHESADTEEAWSDSEPVHEARIFKLGGLEGGVKVELPEKKDQPERNLEVGLKIEARTTRDAGGSKGAALEIVEIGGNKCHRLETEAEPVVPLFPRVIPKFQPRETHGTNKPEWQAPEWSGSSATRQPRSLRWMLHWCGIILGMIAMSFLIRYLVSLRDATQDQSPYARFSLVPDEYDATKPSTFFDEHPDWMSLRTLAAFHAYRNAKTYQEALPFMRKTAKAGEIQREWKPWRANLPAS